MSNKIYKTIIIEDEAPARTGLKNLLKAFPETFTIIDIAKNGIEGAEKIEKLKPDVAFLDIEMPGCNGFEMLEKLTIIPIVIFCTAYDQYSLKAFETNSIDYLVKPISIERLQHTVNKLKLFSETDISQNIEKLLAELNKNKEVKKMTSITVKKKDKIIFIKLNDVHFFQSNNNYTIINSKLENHLSSESITSLEQKLPDNFIRVHRSIIINKDFVSDIQKYFNSRFIITLKDKKATSVTSGRSYNEAIKTWMRI